MKVKLVNTNPDKFIVIRLIPSVNAEANVEKASATLRKDDGVVTVALAGKTGE